MYLPDSTFKVHSYQASAAADGSLQISGPTTQGPFGNPTVHGHPTALAVIPRPPDPTDPWIAIATSTGRVILIRGGRRMEHLDLAGPVVDLAVVPQVSYFAFVALVNSRDGQQHLVGIRPPDTMADPTSAQVSFDLVAADDRIRDHAPQEADEVWTPSL